MTNEQIKERCEQYFTQHLPGLDAECGGKWLEPLYREAMTAGMESAAVMCELMVMSTPHNLATSIRKIKEEAQRVKEGHEDRKA